MAPMRSAAPVRSRPVLLGAFAAGIAALLVAWRAAGFGALPACGTGGAFLEPIAWMVDLGTVTFVAVAIASLVLLVIGRESRTLLAFVGAITVVAALATAWSELVADCARYRGGTWAIGAVLAAGTAGLAGAAVALLVMRTAVRRRGVETRPVVGPRTRIVGHYRVSGGSAAPAGSTAWAVVSPSDVTLIGSGGRILARVPRRGLEVDVVGDRVFVLADARPWAILVPDGDTDPMALGTELSPGQARRTAGAPGGS
jgi:hypothetical protein